VYNQTKQKIEASSIGYNPFSVFDYEPTTQRQTTTVYSAKNRGCLSRFIRIVFIIFIVRMVLYFIFSFASTTHRNNFNSHGQPTTSYSQGLQEGQNQSSDSYSAQCQPLCDLISDF
jgi:hypothetical protein